MGNTAAIWIKCMQPSMRPRNIFESTLQDKKMLSQRNRSQESLSRLAMSVPNPVCMMIGVFGLLEVTGSGESGTTKQVTGLNDCAKTGVESIRFSSRLVASEKAGNGG
jgi:hypothetical protein